MSRKSWNSTYQSCDNDFREMIESINLEEEKRLKTIPKSTHSNNNNNSRPTQSSFEEERQFRDMIRSINLAETNRIQNHHHHQKGQSWGSAAEKGVNEKEKPVKIIFPTSPPAAHQLFNVVRHPVSRPHGQESGPKTINNCVSRYYYPQVIPKSIGFYSTISDHQTNNSQNYWFIQQTIQPGDSYVVKVTQNRSTPFNDGWLLFGVTACDPTTISWSLPKDPNDLLDRPEYWSVVVLREDPHKVEVQNSKNPKIGDEFLFSFTIQGEICVSKNNESWSQRRTIMHADNSVALWHFFNLTHGSIAEIILLGKTNPSKNFPGQLLVTNKSQIGGFKRAKVHVDIGGGGAKDKDDGPASPDSAGSISSTHPEVQECQICYDKPVDSLIYPCGHMCTCLDCGKAHWTQGVKSVERKAKCPICRTEIKDVVKTFKS